MNQRTRALMAFHATIVLLIGLLVGIPFASIASGQQQGDERAWRMAHLEGVLNGLMVFAFAALGGVLTLSKGWHRVLAWSAVVAAYANTLASWLGAATGHRGLQLASPLANNVVFLGFLLAMAGVFVAVGLVLVGSWRTMRGLPSDVGAAS